MASLRSLSALRRSLVTRSFHSTSLKKAGGNHSPPLPPFARSPARFEKMTENSDCLWDDGVAPELALDFDLPNTSSREALWTLGGALAGFFVFYQGIKATTNLETANPALNHSTDCVIPDFSILEKARQTK